MPKNDLKLDGPATQRPAVQIVPRAHAAPDDREREALLKVLERDETARIVHGGLRGLLSLSDDDCAALIGYLKKL